MDFWRENSNHGHFCVDCFCFIGLWFQAGIMRDADGILARYKWDSCGIQLDFSDLNKGKIQVKSKRDFGGNAKNLALKFKYRGLFVLLC